MPDPTISDLPPAPSPTDTREEFSAKSFAFYAALAAFVTQVNAVVAWIASAVASVAANALAVLTNKQAVDTNTALVANYASAAAWVAGVYAKDVVVFSPVNQRLYRKYTTTGATATDPSADPANWVLANAMVPFTPVTTATHVAESGGRYSLQKTTTEGAATNLLLRSEEFGHAAWTATGMTVTSNSTNSPDGAVVADTLTNTAGATSLLSQSVTVGASATNDYYASLFVKKGNSSTMTLNVFYTGGTESNLTVNLDTGTATGAPYAGEYIVQPYGDGWRRIGFRILRDATGTRTSIAFRIWESTRAAGVADNNTIVWGAQLEAGNVATSYVQSVAAPGTRSAGIVPPQRIVFPPNPPANAYVSVHVGNGIQTNVVDPNGQTLEDEVGPALLDVRAGSVDFQFLNNTWKVI